MLKSLATRRNQRQTQIIYQDNWAHLSAELRLLDLRIRALVIRQRQGLERSNSQFAGLAISETEIDRILEVNRPPTDSLPQLARIAEEIAALEQEIDQRVEHSCEQGVYLPLQRMVQAFGLSDLERQCVVMCLALEIDRKYETVYAYLNDDVTSKAPSIYLLMQLLGLSVREVPAVRSYFEPYSPLHQYILVLPKSGHKGAAAHLSTPLKLDERMRDFILGSARLDSGLITYTNVVNPDNLEKPLLLDEDKQEAMRKLVGHRLQNPDPGAPNTVIYLHGPAGAGRKTHVKNLSRHFSRLLFMVDVEKMLNAEEPFIENVARLQREAVLHRALLCFDNFDVLLEEVNTNLKKLQDLLGLLHNCEPVSFLIGTKPWKPLNLLGGMGFVNVGFDLPNESERKLLWTAFANQYKFAETVEWGEFAGKFRFTPGQTANALAAAQHLSLYRHPTDQRLEQADLYQACYAQASHRLEKKASKIVPRYNLDDIILPPEGTQLLMAVCNQVKYRHVVYGDWGFDKKLAYGKGLSAIFTGPPGTGKTMAAQIIAGTLGLELYKIDLSQVMSKYIGETEKNLQEVFDQAQTSNAVLFFDEADALFGKRSEVKDARDRYANLETAYLLQKMEEYSGVSILATNLLGNIDEAFMRRLQFIIEFPFPNAAYREKIWRRIFPSQAPLNDDIDFEFIAEKFEISGGNIKNIAISAAFYAAEQDKPISMEHIIRATRYELKKIGRILLKEEFGEYYFLE